MMNARTVRLIVLWNIVLTTVLVVSLGLNAAWTQAANDPPMQVFEAPVAAGGTNGISPVVPDITSADSWNPTTLMTLSITPTGTKEWTCLVIATMQANQNGNGIYGIDVWKNNGRLTDSRRMYEFTANADNDQDYIPVSVSTIVRNIPSNGTTTTFKLTGYKSSAGTPDGYVDGGNLSAVCFDSRLKK